MEKNCEFCFEDLRPGTVHKQVPWSDGTRCKAVTCDTCHGRGGLPYNIGYEACPTCCVPASAYVPSRPQGMLGQDEAEAQRLTYGGRRIAVLRESKTFDRERVEASPLFKPTMPTLF